MGKTLATSALVLMLAWAAHAGRAVRGTMHSAVLKTTITYTVVLPADYESEVARGVRFPVLYLLHCAGCYDQTWIEAGPEGADAKRLIDSVDMILAAPFDGNTLSWWIDSPVRKNSEFSTFLAGEFRAHIDSSYATCRSRAMRGLAGHSMGGYGALHNLRKHASLFSAAYSFKGCTDLLAWSARFGIAEVVGDPSTQQANYNALTIAGRAADFAALPPSRIHLCNGVYDTWFSTENKKFHAELGKAGVAHGYEEIPEDHFAVRTIRMMSILKWFDAHFKQGLCVPQKTRYTPVPSRGALTPRPDPKRRIDFAGRAAGGWRTGLKDPGHPVSR